MKKLNLIFNKVSLIRPNPSFTYVSARGFASKLEEQKAQKEKKAFQDDIKYFLSKNSFTLHDFQERVQHGLKQKSSFKLMLWKDDEEVKILDTQNKILSAMYDHEKSEFKLISPEEKKEIAETVQVTPADVNDVFHKYRQLDSFHKWLVTRQQSGDKIPEDREELMMIYKTERPSFLMAQQKSRAPRGKKALQYSIRRHLT